MTASNSLREKLGVKPPSEIVSWLNFLVYGEAGAGKTYLGGTAQDHQDTSPVLVIDVEGGTVTLRNRPDIDIVEARSMEQLTAIYNDLYKSIDPKTNTIYYKTVMIDTLTELQKLDMHFIMKELISRRPDLDPDVPSMREWGKNGEHLRRIVRAFRDLPTNVIFTCHAAMTLDQSTNVTTYAPMLSGKLKAEIPGFLDVVGYLYTVAQEGETVRKLQVAKTQRVVAKDRTDALGDVIDSPSIPLMWEMIHSPQPKEKAA